MRHLAQVLIALAGGLAGCGDGILRPDAAMAPDASGGLVSVQFVSNRSLQRGHQVLFQNADSSVVLATRTSDDGSANAFMRSGGFVTVVVQRAGTHFMYTVADVQVGDEIVIDERLPSQIEPGGQQLVQLTVLIPADPDSLGYQLRTTCGGASITSTGQAISFSLPVCAPTIDILVVSLGSSVDSPADDRFLYRKDVDITNNDLVRFEGPYRDADPSVIAATNVPATTELMFVQHSLIAGRNATLHVSILDPLNADDPVMHLVDGAGTLALPMFAQAEGTLMTRIRPTPQGLLSRQHVVQWGPVSAVTSIDFGTPMLRPYSSPPVFDSLSSSVRWGESVEGIAADAALLGLVWFRPETGESFNWFALGPRDEDPTLRLPVVPHDAWRPAADATPVFLTNIAAEGGYPSLRPRLLGAWRPDLVELRWPTDTPTGRVVYRNLDF